jgi:fermentation-respiration switch protein FrsA (DUF1100 family)
VAAGAGSGQQYDHGRHPFEGGRRRRARIVYVTLLVALACPLVAFFLPDDDFQKACLLRKGALRSVVVTERGNGEGSLDKSFLTLKSGSGLEVDVGVLSPPRDGRRHPAVILLPGNAAGAHAVDEALDVDDVVTVSLGYRYAPPEDAGVMDSLRDVQKARHALLDVVPGALLVSDYLRSREDVDPTRIAVVGLSFGALYVPAIAAQERGLAAAVLVDGGGDLRSLLAHNVERAGFSALAPVAGVLGARLLRPLEPLRHAPRVAPVPLVMINATEDELVPRENALALYAVAQEPKSLVWLEVGHVHLGDRVLLGRVVGAVRKALARLGVLESATSGMSPRERPSARPTTLGISRQAPYPS